jgi:hypothetical protein
VSQTDSFIEEVTEEVRRDKLFALFRRYGWIAVAIVLLAVGGAAFREYSISRDIAQAQAHGDAIIAAVQAETAQDRAAELSAIQADGTAQAVVNMMAAASQAEAGATDAAVAAYLAIAAQSDLPRRYTDLAVLRATILQSGVTDPQERMITLTGLAQPGAPYRTLAEEQMALIEIEMGDAEAAILRLQAVLQDQETTAGLRRRASDVIVALGGTPGS